MYKSLSFVIALIGQNSVGKSTLFNKLIKTNLALISNNNLSVTRDRQYGYFQYKKYEFTIIDTGAFNRLSKTSIQNAINAQTISAIEESNVVFFVVNGLLQVSSIDYDIANYLIKLGKDVLVLINKVDNLTKNSNHTMYGYYSLGIRDVFFISAMHGYGINKVLEKIYHKTSREMYEYGKHENENKFINKNFLDFSFKTSQFIKLAVVGRPNSGKSTFINYVLKKNRMITDIEPGTTRDSVYIPVTYNNQKYILIDTAGVRRKKQIKDITEQMSVFRTLNMLNNIHITLFMIDINEGIVDQDLSLLRFILSKSPALIIVVNKWDTEQLVTMRNNINKFLLHKKNFLNYAKIHFISSIYGIGIKLLFESVNKVYQLSVRTISTSKLTKIMQNAITKYPPPFLLGTKIIPKPKYVHIGGYKPLILVIHGNKVSQLSYEYKKYLKKFFCQSLNLQGILVHFIFKDAIKSNFLKRKI